MISPWKNLVATLFALPWLVASPLEANAQLERLPPSTYQDPTWEATAPPPQLNYKPSSPEAVSDGGYCDCVFWTWQPWPESILFHSYMAGVKEPRLSSALLHDDTLGWVWDHSIGARIGAIRYGTTDDVRPQGWQIDIEASTYLRQDPAADLDVIASDFRFGFPLTYVRGPYGFKFAYYHTSSHVGDEFLVKNPTFRRINYVRDAVVLGIEHFVKDNLRLYGEVEYAFNIYGGAEPWAFQFGGEFSPRIFNGFRGTPFVALNAHLRQEFDYGGSVNFEAGWQWRTKSTNKVLRTGFQYYSGKSPLFEFFDRQEELIGLGVWYDF